MADPFQPDRSPAFSRDDLDRIFETLAGKTIGVVGDFCLDLYLFVDSTETEPSIETGQLTSPVSAYRASPGGAANVAANLAALGTGRVVTYGVVGNDFHSDELTRLLHSAGVAIDRLVRQPEEWAGQTYMKVIEGGSERGRFDFGITNRLHESSAKAVLDGIRADISGLDALIVNQQLGTGLHTAGFRSLLVEALRDVHGVIVDSRDYADEFGSAVRKLNAREAARLCGYEPVPQSGDDEVSLEAAEGYARRIADRFGCSVVVTVGADGCLAASSKQSTHLPGVHQIGELDTVGAGDALLAGFAAGLAAGLPLQEAALLGNLDAAVSVRKLFQTGVTSQRELIEIAADPDYRYNSRLVEEGYSRVYADAPKSDASGSVASGSDAAPASSAARGKTTRGRTTDACVEILDGMPPARVRYAVFDHDGTISTIRQGWEPVMLETMVSAVLGRRAPAEEIGGQTYSKVEDACREFIDSTTGVQTLVQMEGLRELVSKFGIAESVLSAAEYKARYNAELMRFVNRRLESLRIGRLSTSELTICGATEFLRDLSDRGVRLYLASGTDVEDVRREAAALGYADLFGNRIYGATGDIRSEPKRMALRSILEDIAASGGIATAGEIVTFGDGPVEMRETRKRGGFCVGLASDEVRRFGWNESKRTRLVLAGAHILIPDFGCRDQLSAYLFDRKGGLL